MASRRRGCNLPRHAAVDYGRVIGQRQRVVGAGAEWRRYCRGSSSSTSRARVRRGRRRRQAAGFVIGFLSQTDPQEAYIHFVGVSPERRGEGIGRTLYERFEEARGQGRSLVRCVTSPANGDSVAFHEALGFEVDRVAEDYDGPGEDRVLLLKRLA